MCRLNPVLLALLVLTAAACDGGGEPSPESRSLDGLVGQVPGLFAATGAPITSDVRVVVGTQYLDERRKEAPIQEHVFAFGSADGGARWSGGAWALEADLFDRTIINGQTGTTTGPGNTLHVFFEEYVRPGTPEGRFFHRRVAPR